jgi:hypothetical protein
MVIIIGDKNRRRQQESQISAYVGTGETPGPPKARNTGWKAGAT